MTRSFLMRSAAASVPLIIGIVLVRGEDSLYDKLIASWSVAEVVIGLSALTAFLVALAIWVLVELAHCPCWRNRKSAAIIAVIAAACVSSQRAEAWIMMPKNMPKLPTPTVEIYQPFILPVETQQQVDAAIDQVSKSARDNPGFVITIEMAIGIFIAAVIVGTTLVIIVRLVCKSLDRMKEDLRNRLAKLKIFLENPGDTNSPAIIGAGLFMQRQATTNDLPGGLEFNLTFTASSEPVTLTGTVASGETIAFDELLSVFGLKNNLPSDSYSGTGIYHASNGAYVVSPDGSSNLVKLSIQSCTNLAQNVWSQAVDLRVPAGALVDFADLTGETEQRFWRVGISQ